MPLDPQLKQDWEAAALISFHREPDLMFLGEQRREPPQLPLDELVGFLGFWVKWTCSAASNAGAPPDYTFATLLSAASALVGNARWVSPWEGWKEPMTLWTAIVGGPGDGKSPGADPVFRLISQLEASLTEDFEATLRRYETDREYAFAAKESWKAEVKEAVSAGREPPLMPEEAEEPEEPPRPRIKVTDATIEKLAILLSQYPKGLLQHRDEIAGWLENMSRYSAGGSDRTFWLEAYGGRPYSVDRVKAKKTIHIQNLNIPVTGGIQPDRFRSLLLKTDDDGLQARFDWYWPHPVDPCRPTIVPEDDTALWSLRRLLNLQMESAEHGQQPKVLKLEDEAAAFFDEWRKHTIKNSRLAQGPLAGALSKAQGRVLRYAGLFELLAWSSDPTAEEPTLVSIQALAAAIVHFDEYLYPMAERVYGGSVKTHNAKAVSLARWIKLHKPESINAVQIRQGDQKVPGINEREEAEEAIKALVSANWLLDQKKSLPGSKGGRPRVDYPINPRLWEVLL